MPVMANEDPAGLGWSAAAALVVVDGPGVVEDGLRDPPCVLDTVRTGRPTTVTNRSRIGTLRMSPLLRLGNRPLVAVTVGCVGEAISHRRGFSLRAIKAEVCCVRTTRFSTAAGEGSVTDGSLRVSCIQPTRSPREFADARQEVGKEEVDEGPVEAVDLEGPRSIARDNRTRPQAHDHLRAISGGRKDDHRGGSRRQA